MEDWIAWLLGRKLEAPELIAHAALACLLLVLSGSCLALAMSNRRLRSEFQRPAWLAQRINAWSTFAGRSIRAPGARSAQQHLLRVKLYIDHANFSRYWRDIVERGAHVDTIDWPRLPETVLAAVKDLPVANGRQVVYCGTNLYVSFNEDKYYDLLAAIKNGSEKSPFPLAMEEKEIEEWRRENKDLIAEVINKLPFQFGFFVFPFARQVPDNLKNASFRSNGVPPAREKLVDTSLCTDLIADAAGDVYDAALVFSADIDHSPAIILVQEEYKKSVGVVGLKGSAAGALSEVCRFKIDLNERVGAGRRYESMRRQPSNGQRQTTS
jgi:NYN domain-containing protein